MHFSTLFILKNETLENISKSEIDDLFSDRFCYCCGESRPKYRYWCDWFQVGGRWGELFVAKKGLIGDRSWCNEKDPVEKDHYAICEIKDLTEPIDKDCIYAVATKSRIYEAESHREKFDKLIDQINRKEINGVIALIDCHD